VTRFALANPHSEEKTTMLPLKNSSRLVIAALTLLTLSILPVRADLLGTQVGGAMLIQGNPPNYFDPANGYVTGPFGTFPGGSLNGAGTNVIISSSAIEFGFRDGANTDSADFTGTQLILTDASNSGSIDIAYIFTDPAFAGLSKVSDNFPNGGITGNLSGNTITLTMPSFNVGGTFQAIFNVTAVPEPTVFTLIGLGVAALSAFRKFRARAV
jgi:PEP-CTERM motif